MSVGDERVGTTARADQFALRCATCEVRITSHPECHDGESFCCAGCVAGGPCICIRDATVDETLGGAGRMVLALPGDEYATAETVSIAAPAGRSLAGARVGKVVYLDPEGRRRWAILLRVA
jgi:hypothetical protein